MIAHGLREMKQRAGGVEEDGFTLPFFLSP